MSHPNKPATAEEKASMLLPFPSKKCPKKYATPHLA
jgi:hypothetical protein